MFSIGRTQEWEVQAGDRKIILAGTWHFQRLYKNGWMHISIDINGMTVPLIAQLLGATSSPSQNLEMWQVVGRTGWRFGGFTGEIEVSKEQEGHREKECSGVRGRSIPCKSVKTKFH